MNAPDKIYLLKVELEERWPGITEASELNSEKEECYIRKNVLLEWAKSEKTRINQGYTYDWRNDDILYGGTLILDSLINKINSL